MSSFIYKYPHPAVTTDCVILTFHEEMLKILLIKRGIEPYKGQWALPGGFLRMDESAEQGALRELQEETGVTGCTIKQFHTFSAPGRDPRERVITIAFYALMKWQQATGADDAEFADWIPVESLPPLAFDHAEIIKVAMDTIKRDIFFEPVGFELLNEIFSMSELQKVYEAILGKEFDRRNFAKKMKHLNILEEVEDEIECKAPPAEERLPLPFLNSDFFGAPNHPAPSITHSDSEPYIVHNDMCFESNADALYSAPPKRERSSSRRRNLFWRFNRKRYDEIKEDDTLEF